MSCVCIDTDMPVKFMFCRFPEIFSFGYVRMSVFDSEGFDCRIFESASSKALLDSYCTLIIVSESDVKDVESLASVVPVKGPEDHYIFAALLRERKWGHRACRGGLTFLFKVVS